MLSIPRETRHRGHQNRLESSQGAHDSEVEIIKRSLPLPLLITRLERAGKLHIRAFAFENTVNTIIAKAPRSDLIFNRNTTNRRLQNTDGYYYLLAGPVP
jgi:hypothetical protein